MKKRTLLADLMEGIAALESEKTVKATLKKNRGRIQSGARVRSVHRAPLRGPATD
jgi:hypothetical protein